MNKLIAISAVVFLTACTTCPPKKEQLQLVVPQELMQKPDPLRKL